MENLYQADYQDIEFKLDDGKVFGAHRLVLVNSDVEWFKTMLTSQFKDSTQKTVEVHDIESDIFEIALKYAYHIRPKVTNYAYETIYPIFKAANYFTCFSLIHSLTPQDTESVLNCIDCALQFGGEILKRYYGLKLTIDNIRTYFLDKYLESTADLTNSPEKSEENEKMVSEMINETLEISALEQDDIWNFLFESLETCDEECLITLLQKIDYYNIDLGVKIKAVNALTRLAKRGLVPYVEIIHLLSYGPYKFIIETFPLKVGFVSNDPTEIGTFMFGWDPKRKQKLKIVGDMYIPSATMQYIYYDDGESMPSRKSAKVTEATSENKEIRVIPVDDGMFRDIDRGFILKQNPDGTIIAIGVDDNGRIRDLTPQEKEQARATGLGVVPSTVEAAIPMIPMIPKLPEQCKYVYLRGRDKGKRCELYAEGASEYCKNCRKKSAVKILI